MTFLFAFSFTVLSMIVWSGMTLFTYRSAFHNAHLMLHEEMGRILSDNENEDQHINIKDLMDDTRDSLESNGMQMAIVDKSGALIASSTKRHNLWPIPHNDTWMTAHHSYGPYTITLGLPWKRTESALHAQALKLILLGIILTAIATTGTWFLVGRTLMPIRVLSRQARAASVESLRVNLNAPSADAEIVELVDTLNGLLGRLTEAAAARGRFHAAASHELRTPLQALSGHLELAISRERSAREYQVALAEAHRQSQRLIVLTKALLLLNQLDTAPLPDKELTLLEPVCSNILKYLSPAISERNLHISTSMEPDTEVSAAPAHIDMLIRNIIENAIKYATREGNIKVVLSMNLFEVYNDCSPIEETDMNRLFEPFYRPDASRTAGAGGSGLGLAICKAICEANGWRIALTPQQNGIVVKVHFTPVSTHKSA